MRSQQNRLQLAERANLSIVPAARSRRGRLGADEPDVAHADAARARHVSRQRIADEGRLRRGDAERVERVLEDSRGRLRASNLGRIDEHTKQWTNTGILAHLRQVSVEV